MSMTVSGQPEITAFSTNGGAVLLAGLPDVLTSLQPGDNFFTWSYSPTGGTGDVRFSTTIYAQEMTLWVPFSSTAITSEAYPIRPGTLTASVWVDRSVATTAAGQTFLVALKVTTTGNVPTDPAWSVTVAALPGGCGGGCTGTPVKWPILSATNFTDLSGGLFGCGDTGLFYWTFTTTISGEGCVQFSASISGSIAGSGVTAGAASGCLTIVARPPATAQIVSANPNAVLPGKDFDVTVQLNNPGATSVRIFRQHGLLTFSTPDLLYIDPYPLPANAPGIDIAPFSSIPFTAKVHLLDAAVVGTDSIGLSSAGFLGTDLSAKGSVPVTVSTANVTITVIPPAAMVEAQENPWHPLKAALPIRYVTPDGGKIQLKVYSLEGLLVRSLVDEDKAPGDYIALWDGKNESGQVISSGIYLLHFESKGLKTTKKLAVIK
jgi:hypothetical protein